MARMSHEQLRDSMISRLDAEADPSEQADLVCAKGSLGIVADRKQIKKTVKRLRKVDGYRYLVINRADLFAVSPATIGTKIGILDGGGSLLKAADLPRRV